MMTFAWRWAQVGDRVSVHQHDDPHALVPGVIARVRRTPHHTDVAIRLDGEGAARHFPRQYVHSDPKGPAEICPLCPSRSGAAPVAVGGPASTQEE
jgi:hypothetical protein